jgi:hypothetical protein
MGFARVGCECRKCARPVPNPRCARNSCAAFARGGTRGPDVWKPETGVCAFAVTNPRIAQSAIQQQPKRPRLCNHRLTSLANTPIPHPTGCLDAQHRCGSATAVRSQKTQFQGGNYVQLFCGVLYHFRYNMELACNRKIKKPPAGGFFLPCPMFPVFTTVPKRG